MESLGLVLSTLVVTMEFLALRPGPSPVPTPRAIRRLVRRFRALAPLGHWLVLVVTLEECPSCAPVGMWLTHWKQRLSHAAADAPHFLAVGHGDVDLSWAQLDRAGIRAYPVLALLDPRGRVIAVELAFREHVWDKLLAELIPRVPGGR